MNNDNEPERPGNKLEIFESEIRTENGKSKLISSNSWRCFSSPRSYHLNFIIKMTVMAAIGGFLFGYDTGVIGGVDLYLHRDFPLITPEQKEMIVSLAVIGAAFGCILIGPISDNYGRKITIIIADILFIIGSILV